MIPSIIEFTKNTTNKIKFKLNDNILDGNNEGNNDINNRGNNGGKNDINNRCKQKM